ncbi:MAG: HAMP domain-containing sensor histidine kinase [Pseudomonadota bacterium]
MLRTLCWFRLLLCVALFYALPQPDLFTLFSTPSGTPFLAINSLYIVISLVLPVLLWRRWPGFSTQVSAHVFSDLLVIGLLVLSVEGLTQTVASLLCIPVAEAVLLRRSRLLYPVAGVATALVVTTDVVHGQLLTKYPATFALSLAFVAVAYLGTVHLRRIGQADDALRAQHRELSSMTHLAEEILDASTQGMVVLDNRDRVRFVNATAMMLLERHHVDLPIELTQFDSRLHDAISTRADVVNDESRSLSLRLHTSPLRDGNTLVALMDMREIEAMTEQSRLASLGRWSASVAHEIRNPLSAISQAVQLLRDDDCALPRAQIVEIMERNTLRIDAVVRDVLTLSRPVAADRYAHFDTWVAEFHSEFQATHPEAALTVTGQFDAPALIAGDEKRLFHIVNNLCENALIHGADNTVHLALSSATDAVGVMHTLTVSNRGAPLDPAQTSRMFEPFFTTAVGGSGLGLYVVRELCDQLGFSLAYDYRDGVHHLSVLAPDAQHATGIAA